MLRTTATANGLKGEKGRGLRWETMLGWRLEHGQYSGNNWDLTLHNSLERGRVQIRMMILYSADISS